MNLDSARQSTIEACGPNDEAIVKTMAEAAETREGPVAAKTREGPVDLRSAKQVSEANRARAGEKANGARREDRLGKAAASPNSLNLTERGKRLI